GCTTTAEHRVGSSPEPLRIFQWAPKERISIRAPAERLGDWSRCLPSVYSYILDTDLAREVLPVESRSGPPTGALPTIVPIRHGAGHLVSLHRGPSTQP